MYNSVALIIVTILYTITTSYFQNAWCVKPMLQIKSYWLRQAIVVQNWKPGSIECAWISEKLGRALLWDRCSFIHNGRTGAISWCSGGMECHWDTDGFSWHEDISPQSEVKGREGMTGRGPSRDPALLFRPKGHQCLSHLVERERKCKWGVKC